jgi:hypothetical protein
VVALNPYRQFDDNYRSFLSLVAGQIAAGVANAQAYEEERRRAEALAEIDRAKTTFFSNISHEWRVSPDAEPLSSSRCRSGARIYQRIVSEASGCGRRLPFGSAPMSRRAALAA